jgi:hypothetical protein
VWTDFSTIANAEIAKVERLLNTRPRKSLGFRSPQTNDLLRLEPDHFAGTQSAAESKTEQRSLAPRHQLVRSNEMSEVEVKADSKSKAQFVQK